LVLGDTRLLGTSPDRGQPLFHRLPRGGGGGGGGGGTAYQQALIQTSRHHASAPADEGRVGWGGG
jgi:hypothetical protein